VDQLLKMGVNVTIYSGQVNLITPLIIWGLSILKLMIGTTKEGSGELEKQPKTQTYTHLTLVLETFAGWSSVLWPRLPAASKHVLALKSCLFVCPSYWCHSPHVLLQIVWHV
jgi:hypothetical protein